MDLENNEVIDSQEIENVGEEISLEPVETSEDTQITQEQENVTSVTEKPAQSETIKPKKVKTPKPGNLDILKHNSMTALSILKVLSIICAIFATVFVVAGIILVVNNPDIIEAVSRFSTLKNKVQSVIDGNVIIKTFTKDGYQGLAFGAYSLAYGIYLVVLLILMRLMAKVFKTFYAETTPFNKRTIRCLKAVFVVITISAVYLNIFFGIFTGFVLWCVVKIIRYGVELQNTAEKEV